MNYDARTDDLINSCVAEFMRVGARHHAQAIIARMRGMDYESALQEARRYIERVLSEQERTRMPPSIRNCDAPVRVSAPAREVAAQRAS